MKKTKTIWCYLDGKKHCDVVHYALAANVILISYYVVDKGARRWYTVIG